jgi:hypothetical protein
MRTAKIMAFNWFTAKTRLCCLAFSASPWRWQGQLMQDRCDLFRSVYWADSALFPIIFMVFFHMVRVRRTQLKVLDAIICSITILVMHALVAFQLPSKMLLHNMPVFKYPLAVYVNSHTSVRLQARLPFFCLRPVRGDVVKGTVPPIARTMHAADRAICLFQYLIASINSTYSLGIHNSRCSIKRIVEPFATYYR